MRTQEIFRSFLATTFVVGALAAPGVACKSGSESSDSAETAAEVTPAVSYSSRGMVKGMASDRINIHHEPIDSFVDREGKTVGMMSMSMPFAIGKGLVLGELAVGSPVEFTFEVNLSQNPAGTVTAISELPEQTKLNLSGM